MTAGRAKSVERVTKAAQKHKNRVKATINSSGTHKNTLEMKGRQRLGYSSPFYLIIGKKDLLTVPLFSPLLVSSGGRVSSPFGAHHGKWPILCLPEEF